MTAEDQGINSAYRDTQSSGAEIARQASRQLWGVTSTSMFADTMKNFSALSPVIESFKAQIDPQLFAGNMLGDNIFEQYRQEWATSSPLLELTKGLTGTYVSSEMFGVAGLAKLAGSMNFEERFGLETSPALASSFNRLISDTYVRDGISASMFGTDFQDRFKDILGTSNIFEQFSGSVGLTESESMKELMESYRPLATVDFSQLADVELGEDQFEEFLEDHPEIDETYEQIEDTLIRRGLIDVDAVRALETTVKASKQVRFLLVMVALAACSAALSPALDAAPEAVEQQIRDAYGLWGVFITAWAAWITLKSGDDSRR